MLHWFTAARAITPDEEDHPLEHNPDAPDAVPSTPSPEGPPNGMTGKSPQRESAALRKL